MYYPVELDKNIVNLCEARGLRQEKLAEREGVCTTGMRQIEHDCANITRDVLERLAEALEVPVWVLYALQAEPETIGSELYEIQELLRVSGEVVLA